MDSVTSSVSTRELRSELSDIVSRVAFGHERIGLTRNGKLTAVVIGVDDLERLEELEDAEDLAAYRAAKAEDDGSRVTLAELRGDLAGWRAERLANQGWRLPSHLRDLR